LIFEEITNLKDIFNKEPLVVEMDNDSVKDIIKNYNSMGLSAEAFAEQTDLSEKSIESYLKTTESGSATFSGFTSHIENTNKSIGKMGVKTKIATVATKAFKVALSTISVMLIAEGIQILISCLDKLIVTNKEIQENAQKAKERIDELTESFENQKATVDDIKERYAKLAQGIDQLSGKNLTLSTEDYEEFLKLSKQLGEMFPTLISHFENGIPVLNITGDINTITNSLDELIKKEREVINQEILKNIPDVYKGMVKNINKAEKSLNQSNRSADVVSELINDGNVSENEDGSLTLKIDTDLDINEMVAEINNALTTSGYAIDEYISSGYEDLDGSKLLNISFSGEGLKYDDTLRDILSGYLVDIYADIETYSDKIESELNGFKQYLHAYFSTSEFADLSSEMQQTIQQLIYNTDWIGQAKSSGIDTSEWSNELEHWLSKTYVSAISQIDNEEIQNSLSKLFQPNISPEDLIELATKIQQYFDEHGIDISLDFILDEENEDSTTNLVERVNTKNNELAKTDQEEVELDQFFTDYSIDTVAEYNKWLEVTNGIEDATKAMDAYKEAIKQTESEDIDFFTDENLESIEAYKLKISDLSSYLEKINAGNELSSEEMANLNTTYGIVESSIGGYKEALIDAINETIYSSDIMTTLSEAIASCNDAAKKEQLQSLYDNLKNIGIKAKTGADSIIDLDTAITNLKDKAQLIRNVRDNMKELGYIDGSDLDEIIAKYPRLANKVAEYNAGLITSKQLFESLTDAYDTDVKNYAIAVGEKLKMDNTYYSNVLSNIPQWLTKMAEGYGIDFKNFKNLCEAKLALEKQYASKVAIMERALAEANTAIAEIETKTGNAKVEAEYEAFELYGNYKKAEKQVKDVQDMINGLDTSLIGTVDFDTSWESFGKGIDSDKDSGKDGGKDDGKDTGSEDKQAIDWLEQSLKVLEAEVDKFQTALEDTHGIENQIAAIDNLNEALENLKTGYQTAYDNYETRYNNALNSLGKNKNSIKNKIESGTEFDLKEYDSETAEKIQTAIDAYNNMTETQVKIDELSKQINNNENLEKSKYRQEDYEKQLETVNEKLEDQTLSASDKNKLLDEQLALQKSINDELRKQAEYINDYETVDKLNQEDKNNALETKLTKIKNSQEENQKLIDRYEEILKDESLSMNDIYDVNRKLQESTNKDFKYLMESEISKIDPDIWKKYISDLKKKYKETKLADKKFIKKHIAEISDYFENTDMAKIYQEYLNSEDDFAETNYETFKNTLDYRINNNENDITDIKNGIESKGGRGTKEQYTQMSKLYQDNLFYLTEQKKEAEAMLDTVDEGTAEWDKWNKELQECEDNIHDCNENIKECYSSILKLPLNDIEDSLDEINKKLEDIDEQISDYDTIISAAGAILDDQIDAYGLLKESIQDQIDALQEENDLRESLLSIQKAEWELQKAKEQRSSKVYKEGEGFVYEADMEQVQSAQENYDSALFDRKIFLLEQQLDLYDEEINKLDEIKNKWNSIVGDIQDTMNINEALSYDPDFFKKVIEDDYSLIADVSGNYRYLLESESSLEEQQNSYEKLRDIINDVVEKYEREAMTYEEARRRISSAIKVYYPEIYGTYNSESNSLSQIIGQKLTNEIVTEETNEAMLKSYQDFSDKMSTIFKDLNGLLDGFSTKSQDTITSIKNSIASLKSELQDDNDDTNVTINGSFKTKSSGNLGIVGVSRTAGKSHSGLELGYLGDGTVSGDKEAFRYIALNDLKNDEIVRVLQKSEGVITESQVMQTMDNFRKLTQVKIPTIIPNTTQANQSISFNGDIIVQGVQDANSFARKLKQNLPSAFAQEFYRK